MKPVTRILIILTVFILLLIIAFKLSRATDDNSQLNKKRLLGFKHKERSEDIYIPRGKLHESEEMRPSNKTYTQRRTDSNPTHHNKSSSGLKQFYEMFDETKDKLPYRESTHGRNIAFQSPKQQSSSTFQSLKNQSSSINEVEAIFSPTGTNKGVFEGIDDDESDQEKGSRRNSSENEIE